MKVRILLIYLAAIVLVLLSICLIGYTSKTKPSILQTNAVTEAASALAGSQDDSKRTATTTSLPPPSSEQAQRPNRIDTERNWASEPLPPGSNLQERLNELARRRGVPLNVLTQQALEQWSNAVQEMSQQMNRPIEFYGKAVKENGEPLRGAKVNFSCFSFPEKRLVTNAVTDDQGLFLLTGVSGATLIVRVSNMDYEELQGTNQNNFNYYSPTGAGFSPDPSNPIIFYVRKKE